MVQKYEPRFHITAAKLQSVDLWFGRVGKWMLMIGYIILGIRHVMALVAGSSKMCYPIFAGFGYSAGVIWSTIFILLGYFLGESWHQVVSAKHRLVLAMIAALVFAWILVFWLIKTKKVKS